MKKIFVFLLILSPLTCLGQSPVTKGPLHADSSATKKVISKLATFYSDHLAEQAYLHFDKPYYAAGDTIYFKAYVTAGDQHALSAVSGILYADLIDPDDQVKQSLKLRLMYGTAWGDFALPDTLPKGNYRIRAYTRWMLNGKTGDYFDRVISVGSIKTDEITEAMASPSKSANKADVQFMPEGGTLVADVKSKVAFKAVGGDGLGVNIKGEVLDNQNNRVCTFVSTHLGMGYFSLFAETGKTYRAKITFSDGSKATFQLPSPDSKAITLAIDSSSNAGAMIKLAAGEVFYAANKNNYFPVLIYSGGEVSTFICKLDARQVSFGFSKKALHTGVAYVTLFSPLGEPLAERLIFVQHNDLLNLNIPTDKNTYAKREKINFKLNVKGKNSAPSIGQFSVSVIDESIIPVDENKENTILTDLLLTDDLKGYIEQPNYYFANAGDKSAADLDLVMLTHGYRKFQWEQVLNNKYPPITLQPEKFLEISGIAKSLNGKPLNNGTVSLFSMDSSPVIKQTTGADGGFHFTNLVFMDSSRFILKAMNERQRSNTRITYITGVDTVPAVIDSNMFFEPSDSNNAMHTYMENYKAQREDLLRYGSLNGIVLKQVKVNAQPYKSSNLGGAGFADQIIRRGDISRGGGVFSQRFDGRLMGVKFVGDEGNKTPFLKMIRSLSEAPQPMLIVIDGVPISTDSTIGIDGLIDVDDIETVEVMTSTANEDTYGVRGGAGVLVITSRHGDDSDAISQAAGFLAISPKGFYKAREFYSPRYDGSLRGFARKDLRSTIYWKPELITDKDGNASFEYYNADGTGNYRVVIEGIDDNGNLGRQVFRYKVE